MVVLVLCLALTPAAPTPGAPAPPGGLTVTLGQEGAVAAHVTPGALVVWLGASQSREGWSDHFSHWRHTTSLGLRESSATFAREGGFPRETALVAVDVAAGTWAIATTGPRSSEVPAPQLEEPVFDPRSGLLVSFSYRGPRADVLVVRPGRSAWASRILDGSLLDGDRTSNGVVRVALGTLAPRAANDVPLDGLRTGDIVALVDAHGPAVRVGRYAME